MPSASQAPMPRVRNQLGVSRPVIPRWAAAATPFRGEGPSPSLDTVECDTG